ncbi:ANTAR domain-containing protein [Pseudarthrobacter sp. PH31-O2]|uniref:ANTAR domain-containing protein n=1 Tax=Pseudarthrobacter sp. PH31-O2 TaxID=3046206 RepID=UPI0024BB79F2|nr:ANTAR domain-containing protein [Pseudarthrobacter sp. PH31-O2]MDJ0354442.1 ANTAR domain-containing protein [Pseudarthrobacter sp. PH31-O2]
MEKDGQANDFRRLLGLVDGAGDITDLLDRMAALAAATMGRATGARIGCVLTLRLHKLSPTVTGSSDAAAERRWARYNGEPVAAGNAAALAVPLQLRQDATAVLNFYAPATGLFIGGAVGVAVDFADAASDALRLSIRIAAADLLSRNLKAAMEGRTAINMACGVIIAQSRCSQEEAFGILLRASTSRNQKLHSVATEIVARFSGTTGTTTHFEA